MVITNNILGILINVKNGLFVYVNGQTVNYLFITFSVKIIIKVWIIQESIFPDIINPKTGS